MPPIYIPLKNGAQIPPGAPTLTAQARATLTAQAAGSQMLLQRALLLLVTATQAGRVLWGRVKVGAGPLRGQASGSWPREGSPTSRPASLPLGSPSCCSSLDKDSPSTLCLAALDRMKFSTATVAFTSPDSGGTHGGAGVSLDRAVSLLPYYPQFTVPRPP